MLIVIVTTKNVVIQWVSVTKMGVPGAVCTQSLIMITPAAEDWAY